MIVNKTNIVQPSDSNIESSITKEIIQPEVKAVIQFATSGARSGATPKAIKLGYRALIFLSGLYALLEPEFNISTHVSYLVMKYLSLGVTLIYFTCQQFGWVKPTINTDQSTTL